MKLYQTYAWRDPKTPYTIEEAVDRTCAADREGGLLERTSSQADATTAMLGRLISKLHSYKALDDEDVLDVIGRHIWVTVPAKDEDA